MDKVFNSQLMVLNHKINFVKEQSFKSKLIHLIYVIVFLYILVHVYQFIRLNILAYFKQLSFLPLTDARCSQDVMDVLEKLRIKAVTKIRQYLLEQISRFRKPLTNYQVPQSVLLKNK